MNSFGNPYNPSDFAGEDSDPEFSEPSTKIC